MTELHWILLGFAGVLVVGVFIYNAIQERRLRRQLEQALRRGHETGEPAEAEEAGEEGTQKGAETEEEADDWGYPDPDPGERLEEAAEGTESGSASLSDAQAEALPESEPGPDEVEFPDHELPPGILDPHSEYVVRARFARPRTAAFAELRRLLLAVGKPARVAGLTPEGVWEPVSAELRESAYAALEAGMLMVNRDGPVQGNMLNEFCRIVQNFGNQYGARFECPDTKGIFDRARELDRFCAEVDVQIGLNIVAPAGFAAPAATIDRLAMAAGLEYEPAAGVYYMRDAQGRIQYSLAPGQMDGGGESLPVLVPQRIRLTLDVPRAANGEVALDRMVRLTQNLATELGGTVVDDQGRKILPAVIDRFAQGMQDLHARMRARGIEPGSERALRLFS